MDISKIKISVVIPVLNAAEYLPSLLSAILKQQPAPHEIILVDSMSKDRTREIALGFEKVRIVPIEKFSHGGARNLGVREASGDIVVLMTQDALPQNEVWLANLLEPFADDKVAATYSRQIPRDDASPMERFFLETHFPPGGSVRRVWEGGSDLTFQQVFFSNVSAALRRDLLLKYPFDEQLIMSEDQQVSRDLLNAGYAVIYQPESVVIHSHNYSLATVFRRYFDSVYSIMQIFPNHGLDTSSKIGRIYLAREVRYMLKRYPYWLPYYVMYNMAKAGGALAAHCVDWLPRPVVRKMSLHRYYWDV